ncbi:hypothetical protein GN244_ATG13762 [Phytophthora infestans]|uniref:Uncharacterized protein n=1 Tax=Phytophthora infestans TaxID=4787 RepID=A0A833W9V3_PHYIN|nr:hypothetical protein GN244_ATG13762 [Phytophthora infestans]
MAMTTRNTARRVLRSDTAPARRLWELDSGNREDSASGAMNRGRPEPHQRFTQRETGITDLRREFTAAQQALRVKATTELTNLNSNIGTEMTEIKRQLANLVQYKLYPNMSATLNQTQATATAAQQIGGEDRTRTQHTVAPVVSTAPDPHQPIGVGTADVAMASVPGAPTIAGFTTFTQDGRESAKFRGSDRRNKD